jgi:hypothetical protein
MFLVRVSLVINFGILSDKFSSQNNWFSSSKLKLFNKILEHFLKQ